MQQGIFGLTPSATPAATDRPYIITTTHGCVDHKCIVQGGDDIYYLAPDGIRSLKRTVQDRLQTGVSYPISYRLKDEFENITWAQASKFHMQFWDGKLFFFFASGASEINRCWIYWPHLDDGTGRGWSIATGWAITATAKFFVSGEERLYGGSSDGKVYRMWVNKDDEGTAINMQLETREEDFGLPNIHKYGGEIEVVGDAVGNYNVSVEASVDGGGWTSLGTLNLSSSGPTLPVDLPFYLQSGARARDTFHLDALGRFKTIKFRFIHNATSGSDQIRVLEWNVLTYQDMYESE